MVILDFFGWWYAAGWRGVITSNRRRLRGLSAMSSAGLLLRTLFAPWRRIVTAPGAGLGAHFRAMGDNFVSRCVGFVVRLVVLIAAALLFVGLAIGTVLEFLIWPLLPIASVVAIVWGLV